MCRYTVKPSHLKWDKYARVLSSEYRKKVVLALFNGERTPKELAGVTGLNLSHVSNTLKELSELGVTVCLSPQLRKGRLYSLTPEGKTLGKKLKDRNQPDAERDS